MNKIIIILLLTSCSASVASCTSSKVSAVREIEQLSNQGKCEEAEQITSSKFRKAEYYLVMGGIADECRGDKKAAVRYMTIAARDGIEPAVSWLIQNNITPPKIQHTAEITSPKPQASKTTVIVQQKSEGPFGQNLNSCIQDGGSRFCYNRQSQRYSNGGIINRGTPYSGSYKTPYD